MKKETTYIGSGIFVNFLHLLLCSLIFVINSLISTNSIIFMLIFIFLQFFIWFIGGFKYSIGNNVVEKKSIFISGIYAILPILIFSVITLMVSIFQKVDFQGWNEFFFLGAPLMFWNKPALLLSLIFEGNGYLLFFVNYLLLVISFFLGGNFAFSLKTGRNAKRRKRKARVANSRNREALEDSKADTNINQ